MFAQACRRIHECIYELVGHARVRGQQFIANGTAFMIAPGILVTAAHNVHEENNTDKPVLSRFEASRSPEIGQPREAVSLITTDPDRDLALLRIDDPRCTEHVRLVTDVVPTGTSCGSLGFPLAYISDTNGVFYVVERFQGSHISSYQKFDSPSGLTLTFYETDSLMYGGSSGCPGFLCDGRVFGMHLGSRHEEAPVGRGLLRKWSIATRLAISTWAPAAEIKQFAIANGIELED